MRKIISFIMTLFIGISLVLIAGRYDGVAAHKETVFPLYVEANDPIKATLEVYPNPADDYIYLKTDEVIPEIELSVMSFIGTKLETEVEAINKYLYKIDLSSIPSGHYYVVIKSDTRQSVKKFIKK